MIRSIHLTAICGTGMGTLACMLEASGFKVTGSDVNIYPPMSEQLKEHKIPVFDGFKPENLDHGPDLVIIGNAISRDNPEAVAVMERQIPYMSMPQAVNRFIARDKKIILVTGTHGKTTTAAVMAYMLFCAGLDPSFLIGGVLLDFGCGFRMGKGPYMVIEGDEYDTAFFDKESKFLHYDPDVTIMTGIEFDHADIFNDLDHVKQAFKRLMEKLRPQTLLIAASNSPEIDDILPAAKSLVTRYDAQGQGADGHKDGWRMENYEAADSIARFDVFNGNALCCSVRTRLMGMHNAGNILSCIGAADHIGLDTGQIRTALEQFSGVKRRQEIIGVKRGITVMDDFAHHPSAVKKTLAAVKPFFKDGRVIAVFEPRSNTSMRKVFQAVYPFAFEHADIVCVREPSMLSKIPENLRLSAKKLVDDMKDNCKSAFYFSSTQDIINFLVLEAREKDLILIMSNGGFDNIHHRLLACL